MGFQSKFPSHESATAPEPSEADRIMGEALADVDQLRRDIAAMRPALEALLAAKEQAACHCRAAIYPRSAFTDIHVDVRFRSSAELAELLRLLARQGYRQTLPRQTYSDFVSYHCGPITIYARPAKVNGATCRLEKVGERIEPEYKIVCA